MRENVAVFPCEYCGWSDAGEVFAHHIRPGTILQERYTIGKVLGQGGFGITYLGWDEVLSVKVAIKEYFPLSLVTRNPDTMKISFAGAEAREDFDYGIEKFLEEARILASFAHSPNIVSTKDFFREEALAYMVMEYVEGTDFRRYLADRGGTIPWEQAQSVIMHVADALKDVHAQGFLHRDISPDNIFITNRGQIKVLDFGSARFAFGSQNKSLSVILKPGYAPVEQYQTRGHQGPWTDVYSLGATLYRCVVGSLPPESLSRYDDDKLKPPSALGIVVPPTFEAALIKALAVRAKDRFQSVQDFQTALLGRLPETSTIAYTGSIGVGGGILRSERRVGGGRRFFPFSLSNILIAVLCLLGVVAASFLFLPENPQAEPPAPSAEIPKAEIPKVETPKAEAPRAETSKTEAPKAATPKLEVPKAEPPKAEPPKAEILKAETPKTEAPKAEPPKVEVSKAATPKAEILKAETPKAEVPKAATPEAETPKAEILKAETPKAEVPKAEPPKTEIPKAATPEAEPPKAEISKAEILKAETPETEVPETEPPEAEVLKAETPEVEQDPAELFSMGNACRNEKNYEKAVEFYGRAAELGHVEAMTTLGFMYEQGTEIEKNVSKAVEWYEKAANHGEKGIELHLARIYYNGFGVPRNYKKASEFLENAANAGNVEGQYMLGVMLESGGNGLQRDTAKAVHYLTKPAEAQYRDSRARLEELKRKKN
jgi:serine/threonine protein kinase